MRAQATGPSARLLAVHSSRASVALSTKLSRESESADAEASHERPVEHRPDRSRVLVTGSSAAPDVGWPVTRTSTLPLQRRRPDEVDDVLGEFRAGVLLQEVPGVRDHRVLAALRAGQCALEDRRHRAGDRVAVAERDQARDRRACAAPSHAARLASLAGSSGVIGTRPGMARGPAWYVRAGERRVVGGADLVAHRARAAGLHEPADVDRRRVSASRRGTGARSRACRGRRSAGRCSRRRCGRSAPGARPTSRSPISPPQSCPTRVTLVQVEHVEDQRAHPLDVPRVAVVRDVGGLVRAAEADEVGRDRAQPGGGEQRDHRAVQERPGRLAVQQQHRLGRRPGRPRPRPCAACRRRRSGTSA